jgi:hypothetical protein
MLRSPENRRLILGIRVAPLRQQSRSISIEDRDESLVRLDPKFVAVLDQASRVAGPEAINEGAFPRA